jgi:hypothetical protein
MGKFLTILIVVAAVAMGAGMYYLQVYAYYEPVTLSETGAEPGTTRIVMTPLDGPEPEPILVTDFKGIDAQSSPLRFRACFKTPQSLAMMTETYVTYDNPTPLNAPKWFKCFDARAIGTDLENGKALAFLGEENIIYGVDRIIAVYDDGRAFAWHQLNHCGEVVYDGQPAPEGCPPPPERTK